MLRPWTSHRLRIWRAESIIHVRSCTNRALLTNHEHWYEAQGLRPLAGFGEARLTGTYGYVNLTHRERCLLMRTNIEIHDQLMLEAMRSGLARTRRATVEAGLGPLVQVRRQAAIRRLPCKVNSGR